MNRSVASRLFACTPSIDCQNLKDCRAISLKAVLILSKDFLDFESDMIVK